MYTPVPLLNTVTEEDEGVSLVCTCAEVAFPDRNSNPDELDLDTPIKPGVPPSPIFTRVITLRLRTVIWFGEANVRPMLLAPVEVSWLPM